jgi:hypothetical protein
MKKQLVVPFRRQLDSLFTQLTNDRLFRERILKKLEEAIGPALRKKIGHCQFFLTSILDIRNVTTREPIPSNSSFEDLMPHPSCRSGPLPWSTCKHCSAQRRSSFDLESSPTSLSIFLNIVPSPEVETGELDEFFARCKSPRASQVSGPPADCRPFLMKCFPINIKARVELVVFHLDSRLIVTDRIASIRS